MPGRRALRVVTAVLLMWVAADLAAIHTCALQGSHGQAPTRRSVSAPPCAGGPVHSDVALHPDHCFCHGVSTGADLTPALIGPQASSQAVPDGAAGHLARLSSVLDHPPQLPS